MPGIFVMSWHKLDQVTLLRQHQSECLSHLNLPAFVWGYFRSTKVTVGKDQKKYFFHDGQCFETIKNKII